MDPIDRIDLKRLLRPEAGRRFQRGNTFVAGCRACGAEFRSAEDALHHVEEAHNLTGGSLSASVLIRRY